MIEKSRAESFRTMCPRCINEIYFEGRDIYIDFLYGKEVFIIDCETCEYEIVIVYELHTI